MRVLVTTSMNLRPSDVAPSKLINNSATEGSRWIVRRLGRTLDLAELVTYPQR